MIYLQTKWKDFKYWIENKKSDRLDKNIKIYAVSKNISSLFKGESYSVNEIFDSETVCNYDKIELNKNHLKITFNSKSETEYRIDLFKIVEEGISVNHIGFTKNDDIFDTIPTNEKEQEEFDTKYELPTNKNEVYDVLSRIRFILIDLVKNKIVDNYFCIGGTGLNTKNKIYEFFLLKVVGEEGFEKKETKVYLKTGWGIYFKV